MAQYTQVINKKVFVSLSNTLKSDLVFSVSMLLAVASCFLYTPKASFIDFKVLISLFNLMIVVKAFEELHLLDRAAISILNKCRTSRKVSYILIFLCFFSSMLITNDVALLTFVPLTLIIGKHMDKPMFKTVILQTLAANLGSSLTPMGNPQNLYTFSFYKLTSMQFFSSVALVILAGLAWLSILNINENKESMNLSLPSIKINSKTKSVLWILLFLLIVASIFNIISFKLALVLTLLTALALDKSLLLKVDYLLLATFICFFIFIGNVSSIESINYFMSHHLKSAASTYFGSIFFSQFISNVPCAILLSKFTSHWKALLLGINIGGMGTLIASLASVISYKLYVRENPEQSKAYMIKFSLYNIISLGLFTLFGYLLIL